MRRRLHNGQIFRALGLPLWFAAACFASSVLLTTWTDALAQDLPQPSPSVASVNGQIITAEELEVAVSSALRGSMTPTDRLQVKSQALDELINQYLIAQQLEANHQQTDPRLLRQFEQLKRQAQANFYINERLQGLPGLYSGAVDRFIQANPDFFLKRRTFHYTEIVVEPTGDISLGDIESTLKGSDIDSLTAWLKLRKAHFVLNRLWQSSEQIEPALLTRLQRMEDGEITVAAFGEHAVIVALRLEASYPDPVEPDDAKLSVAIGLQLSARNQAARAIMADLRSGAKVQLFDVALTLPASFDRGGRVTDRRRALLSQLQTIWLFSLLALVPVAMTAYYRKNATIDWDFENRSEFEYIVRRLFLPNAFIVAMGALLLWPVVDLLTEQFPTRDPFVMTMQALIGIGSGVAISAGIPKVPVLRAIFRHRWSGICTLLFIQCIWFTYSALRE